MIVLVYHTGWTTAVIPSQIIEKFFHLKGPVRICGFWPKTLYRHSLRLCAECKTHNAAHCMKNPAKIRRVFVCLVMNTLYQNILIAQYFAGNSSISVQPPRGWRFQTGQACRLIYRKSTRLRPPSGQRPPTSQKPLRCL